MTFSWWSFFTDPVLRGPTLGAALMALSASLASVFVFVRRQALVGETLSHTAYPGVVFASLIAAFLEKEAWVSPAILLGAFCFVLLGYGAIHLLTHRFKIAKDAALCAVLSSFFGVGVTLASFLQKIHPLGLRRMEAYLYGQAASMTDGHILLYGAFATLILGFVLLFYKELKTLSFDKHFAKTGGIATSFLEVALLILISLSVVMGIRSCGVVLMAAMLIAPPIAARQWTYKFKKLFFLSALFAVGAALLGVVCSTNLSTAGQSHERISVPTGPLIVLFATFFALSSLFFAPKRGLVSKVFRMVRFRFKSGAENILKTLWKQEGLTPATLRKRLSIPKGLFGLLLLWLKKETLVTSVKGVLTLTAKGKAKGSETVRLHRLWELYLTEYLGRDEKNVHDEAEKMEHILSPELERELTALLGNPQRCPHNQPIPQGENAP